MSLESEIRDVREKAVHAVAKRHASRKATWISEGSKATFEFNDTAEYIDYLAKQVVKLQRKNVELHQAYRDAKAGL